MAWLERDQDVGVHASDRRRGAVGHVDGAVRQADVIDDAGYFRGRNHALMAASTRSPSRAVSSIRVPVLARKCRLNRPPSEVGKKSCPSQGNSRKTGAQTPRNTGTNNPRRRMQPVEHTAVSVAERFKARSKAR